MIPVQAPSVYPHTSVSSEALLSAARAGSGSQGMGAGTAGGQAVQGCRGEGLRVKGGRLYTGTGCRQCRGAGVKGCRLCGGAGSSWVQRCRQCRGARVKGEGMQVVYGYRVQAG